MGDDDDAVGHHGIVGRVGTVPLQHGELGKMQVAALAIAKHPRQLEDLWLTRSQQLLAGELRRGPQIPRRTLAVRPGKLGAGRMKMGLIAGGQLQNPGFDLGKTLLVEPGPDCAGDRAPGRAGMA